MMFLPPVRAYHLHLLILLLCLFFKSSLTLENETSVLRQPPPSQEQLLEELPINSINPEDNEETTTDPPPILKIIGLDSNQTMDGLFYSTHGATNESSLGEEEYKESFEHSGSNKTVVTSFIDFLFHKVNEFVYNDTLDKDNFYHDDDDYENKEDNAEEYVLEYFQNDAEAIDSKSKIAPEDSKKEKLATAKAITETTTLPNRIDEATTVHTEETDSTTPVLITYRTEEVTGPTDELITETTIMDIVDVKDKEITSPMPDVSTSNLNVTQEAEEITSSSNESKESFTSEVTKVGPSESFERLKNVSSVESIEAKDKKEFPEPTVKEIVDKAAKSSDKEETDKLEMLPSDEEVDRSGIFPELVTEIVSLPTVPMEELPSTSLPPKIDYEASLSSNMEMESTTIPPTTGSPEYRFIFPQEDVTVHPLETEESVLVNEAGVPRVCISYVDTLRRSFLSQVNELLTNVSASCVPVETECNCPEPTTMQPPVTTTTLSSTTTQTTTTYTTTTTTTTKPTETHIISQNSSQHFHLECHTSFNAELKDLNFELQVTSSSSLLILTQFGRLPSLRAHEDYRLSVSNLTTLRNLSNGTFVKLICLCEEEDGERKEKCEGDISAYETEIKKVSFLSDEPLIVEEPFPQLLMATPVLLCDDRCYVHGSCSNGTCTCNHGWNGKHCTLPGCGNNCGHGECVLQTPENEWGCSCEAGWEGGFCEFPLEQSCSDKIDNDEDGLIDCQDPECCLSDPICSLSQLCLSVDDPINILNTNDSKVQNFFEGVLPLLDRNTGIQRYARMSSFKPSRISIIRGRIVTKKTHSGLPGVRISRENSLGEGFTLSRSDGRFDFVTNGGGIAVLKFGKSPFPFVSRRVHIPSNQILDIGSVILDAEEDWSLGMSNNQEIIKYCPDHIFGNMSVRGLPLSDEVSNVLTLGIEGSMNLGLVYESEANATSIGIHLIQGEPPSSLLRVHLEIRIGGRLIKRLLEPEAELSVEYVWDRRDVYGRPIYGKTQAFLRAGYEYSNCIHSPVWSFKTLSHIQGLRPSFNDGINKGWNLNILHRLEPVSGMLYKGDGTVLDLEQSRFHAELKEFVVGKKGDKPIGVLNRGDSVIVGFSSSINMYSANGAEFETLLLLNASSEENRYFMALHPLNGDIYVSLPSEKIVLRIKDTENVDDAHTNYEIIAGNRKKCRSVHSCGNGGPANESSLIYPKGIDVGSDGTIYLADGRSLRTITHGIINSLDGGGSHQTYEWRPPFSECDVNWQSQDMDLRWPTDLALNPLDENTLIYIDDGDVFEYIIDGRVARPLFAAPSWCSDVSRRSLEYLEEETTSVEFDQGGNLHLVVSRLLSSVSSEKSGVMRLNAQGHLESALPLRDEIDIPMYDFDFISDLSVANDGSYFICDFENEKVHRLSYGELSLNFENKYEVSSPQNNEIYSFSSEGMHLETRALFTDSLLISFLYDNFSNVIGVSNLYKSTLEIVRDYEDPRRPVRRINIDGKLSHDIQIAEEEDGSLQSIRFPSGNIISFGYEGRALIWKLENGKLRTIYEYSSSGFYLRCIHPDGTSDTGRRRSQNSLATQQKDIIKYESQSLPGRSSNKMRTVVLPNSFSENGFDLEWKHYVRASSRSFDSFNGIGKHFMVNGKRSFSLEMHPRSGIQSVYDGGSISKRLLRVEEFYVPPRRLWIPEIDTGLSVVDETFTRDRMLSSVTWDDTFVHFIYDVGGRITSLNSSGRIGNFVYDSPNDAFPSTVHTPTGAEYSILRDGSGGLSSVVTPSNGTFSFHVVPMIGYYLMAYKPPWRPIPFEKKYQRLDQQKLTPPEEGRTTLKESEEGVYRYDESTGRIVEDDVFFYDYGVTSAVVQKTDSTFYGIYESDSLGRETARLMINDGRPIYKESSIYDKDIIAFRSYSLENTDDEGPNKVIKYHFDQQGLLIAYEDDSFKWKYLRDPSGNIINMDFGAGSTEFSIEHGERISRVGDDFDVLYDEMSGYMMSRHEFRFEYDELGRIESTFKGDQLSSSFFYDDWNTQRVTQIYDNGVLVSYAYERRDKPLLPTRVTREISGDSEETVRLFYDHLDRLFFVSLVEQGQQYYVVTDLAGTPELVFDSETGRVVKTFLRSPYGVLIAEKGDPDLWIPIGYKGGIEEHSSGTVILEGRAYDSHLGHYRTPDVNTFLDPTFSLKNVRDVHSYKMVNPVTRPGANILSLNNFESWISFLGLLTPKKITKGLQYILPESFSSVLVQQNFEFRDGNVRFVHLHKGISIDTQLLGPDVIISLNSGDNVISTRNLRGAGTVETILSSLINGTTLMNTPEGGDSKGTNVMHFYRRDLRLPDNLELLKAAGSIIPEITYLSPSSRTLRLKIDVVKFIFTFWMGFDSIEEVAASL